MEARSLDTREICRMLCQLVTVKRDILAEGLKTWRLGYRLDWWGVYEIARWTRDTALMLTNAAGIEVYYLNCELQRRQPGTAVHFKEPKKPRWAKRKAPPQPARLSSEDVEALLSAMLEWMDAIIESADAPKGACYPHMPESMQAVLGRNGFDPHHHRSPDRMIRKYLCW